MTLIPTFFFGSSAGKVVDLEKLHGTEGFPEWTEGIFDGP